MIVNREIRLGGEHGISTCAFLFLRGKSRNPPRWKSLVRNQSQTSREELKNEISSLEKYRTTETETETRTTETVRVEGEGEGEEKEKESEAVCARDRPSDRRG